MFNAARLCTSLVFVLSAFFALVAPTHAGLSGPPESKVQTMPDGWHMLVFLAPVPEIEDEGKIAELPSGEHVNLRKTFPASGYYEVGSATPIWTAPWDGIDGWAVSDDGRFLVRWNRWGHGKYRILEGGELSWALKFYDRGKEIQSYQTDELVDYPSLMEFDSHLNWLGYVDGDLTIRDGQFVAHTSTHEIYRFDIRTGAIIAQRRMWRSVARVAWAVIAVSVLATAALVWKRRRSPSKKSLEATRTSRAGRREFRDFLRLPAYSLRSLLFLMTVIGILCFLLPRWPKSWPLILIAGIAMYATRATVRYQLKRGFGWCSIAASLGWLTGYILSVVPVAVFLRELDLPQDVFFAILINLYRPLIWLHLAWPEQVDFPNWWNQLWESLARLLL